MTINSATSDISTNTPVAIDHAITQTDPTPPVMPEYLNDADIETLLSFAVSGSKPECHVLFISFWSIFEKLYSTDDLIHLVGFLQQTIPLTVSTALKSCSSR
jgi:hypothetical protein